MVNGLRAKNIVDSALSLLGHFNVAGGIDENRELRYYGAAPAILTALQTELAARLGVELPAPVTDLSQELSLDDETATRVMVPGLAMHIALIDRDSDRYNHYSQLYYGNLIASLKPDETFLNDYYGAAGDPTMR